MSGTAAAANPTPAPRALQGPDRAAALLLAMGKPAASRLLKRFDSAELKEIARAASKLGTISAGEIENAIEDFAGEFAAGMSLVGTADEVEKLLTGILPTEQISDIMTDVVGQKTTNGVWERTSQVAEAVLVDFLANEHPQTAAFVLTKLPSESAAGILGLLPQELRNNVMRRMSGLRPVTAPALRLLESSMHEALLTTLGRGSSSDAYLRMADILNRMEADQVQDVLSAVAEGRPDIAKALRRLLFRFEDIAKLSQKARTKVFDQVPADQVVLALRGVEGELQEMILSSLASRSRRMVEHELQSADEVDARAVADSRRQISNRIMQLISKGEIEFNPSENEAE